MTDTDKTSIWVTIAINIGGETKTFEADATTGGDAHDVAKGLLSGLDVVLMTFVLLCMGAGFAGLILSSL